MPIYHVQARITQEALYRVDAEDPEDAVRKMYDAGNTIGLVFGDELVQYLQYESGQTEVTAVMETDFHATPDEPIRDESRLPLEDVDLSQPIDGVKPHVPVVFHRSR